MPDDQESTIHAIAHFSGHVQGVGFRYTTLQVAKEYDVAGYVINLPDGRVRLEAEGRSAEVDRFIAAVGERMHGHVRKTEVTKKTGSAGFQGFEIR